jgi:uncharacterized membrane protein
MGRSRTSRFVSRLTARRRVFVAHLLSALEWSRIYRATSYARSALWIVPIAAIALVLFFAPLLRWLDGMLGWRGTGLDVDGATALYQTVITLSLSFVVFTFGSLLVAIQVASGQLTPRIIATALLRDNVVRYSVGLAVFTLMFTVMALNRVHGHVYQIVAFVVGLLGIACMTNFLFFIDYAARLLRPVSICTRIAEQGLAVIDMVYPRRLADREDPPAPREALHPPGRVVTYTGLSAVVLAVDLQTLAQLARRSDGVIELAPQVGDFIAFGDPLFLLHGGAARIANRKLLASVAVGSERTLEQDPMFVFRIEVDIALKALSPAINDPTTAVLAIDQVHRLLRVVGRRQLRADAVRDAEGAVRVLLRTSDWEDFVHMACVEIRACGAGSVQVARRMHAMLDDLIALLPPIRHPALQAQRALLDRAIDAQHAFAEDAALARIGDVQGLGGSRPPSARPRPRREGVSA